MNKGGIEQKGRGQWMVTRWESGMRVYVGTYATQEQAQTAYDVATAHYEKELKWIAKHRATLSASIEKAING